MPTNILTNSIMATVNQGQGGTVQPLSPALGLLLMAIYAAIALAAGARAVRQARRLSEAGAEEGWVQIRIPQERAEQAKRLAQLIGREPFHRRSWAELGFFLASSALACAGAFVLGALGIAGLALTVVFVGVVILAGGLRAARGLGRWQRALARRMLGEEISEPEPFSARPGFFGWLRASLGDRAAWRTVGYFVAKVPLTIFGVWFALSIWVEALFGYRFASDRRHRDGEVRSLRPIARPRYHGGPPPGLPPTWVCS